jgi:CBS domain-containing protein
VRENLFERQVLAAQNIALSRAPPVIREEMARGDIIDVHDVEPRIDVGRHAAGGGVEHHLTGGRRLHIAWTYGRRGIDDDHRLTRARRLERRLLGKELGALVMTDHRRESHGSLFVARRTIGRDPHGGDAAGVHRPFHPGSPRGLQDVASTLDIGEIQQRWIARAQPVVRRDVKQRAATLHRARERRLVGEITDGDLEGKLS